MLLLLLMLLIASLLPLALIPEQVIPKELRWYEHDLVREELREMCEEGIRNYMLSHPEDLDDLYKAERVVNRIIEEAPKTGRLKSYRYHSIRHYSKLDFQMACSNPDLVTQGFIKPLNRELFVKVCLDLEYSHNEITFYVSWNKIQI